MEKEEPKTLNDLYVTLEDITKKRVVRVDELKAEAVKWVKADEQAMKYMFEESKRGFEICSKKWMERLNITEEDLK